jgi:hypothetical protein
MSTIVWRSDSAAYARPCPRISAYGYVEEECRDRWFELLKAGFELPVHKSLPESCIPRTRGRVLLARHWQAYAATQMHL